MTHSDLLTIENRVKEHLSRNKILGAISELEAMASAARVPWTINQRIATIKESFGYLQRYALSGVTDPSRAQQMSQISNDILSVSASILRQSQIEDSSKLYFSKLRYERLQSDSSILSLVAGYRKLYNSISMKYLGKPDADVSENETIERMAGRIFDVVWTTSPLTAEDEDVLTGIATDESLPLYFKELVLSAVMLGALEYYDERRMVLLARYYLSGVPHLEVKALCAMLLAVWVNRDGLSGKKFHDVFNAVTDRKEWEADFKMAFLEFVRARDTERISRTMTEEIIPQIIKLRPNINKIVSEMESIDELSLSEENPEWAELFDKSGLSDKLQQLNDLQMSGGDVMMSTFSNLKSFPFFHEISNWFLPFYPEHSSVSRILGNIATDLGNIISATPTMCDSDKYSILMTMDQLPASNRRMMFEQFQMQVNHMSELRNSELNPEAVSRENVANKYVQDLYRFFKLFRRKGEFVNPFASPINLAAVGIISPTLGDVEPVRVVAEFYFKYKYYTEASELFSLILSRGGADAQVYQKAGYCRQQAGLFGEALDMYLRSELMRPDSLWTLRRIAYCYKMTGNPQKALAYFEKVAAAKPSDASLALSMGHCYVESGDYDNALKCYFKVEFLDPDSGKALRPIAWCALMKGDYERSEKYYAKVLSGSPSSTDYLNYGHLMMAMGRYDEAVRYYRMTAPSDFEKNIDADRSRIEALGVDPLMIDIVADAVVNAAS